MNLTKPERGVGAIPATPFMPPWSRSVPVILILASGPLVVLLYWMWRVRLRQNLRGLVTTRLIEAPGSAGADIDHLACLIPAIGATRVDPVVASRDALLTVAGPCLVELPQIALLVGH